MSRLFRLLLPILLLPAIAVAQAGPEPVPVPEPPHVPRPLYEPEAELEYIEEISDRIHFDLNAISGLPQGQFADALDRPGFGLNLTATGRPGTGPFRFGFEVGFLFSGQERRTFSDGAAEVTGHHTVLGHGLLRVQPSESALRPYLDLLFGFKFFFSSFGYDEGYDEVVYSETLHHDAVLSYGGGGGVAWRLATFDEPRKHLHLNLGVRYLFGPKATYLTGYAVDAPGADPTLTEHRTRTDLIVPHLGFAVTF